MTTPQILLLAFLGVELLALAGLIGWMLGDAHRHKAWHAAMAQFNEELERDSITEDAA